MVCNIAARVGARTVGAEPQKIVIVDLPGGQAGVLVDAVDAVVTVPEERLAPVPAEVRTHWLAAIARLGEDLVMVLDPERLLDGVVEPPEPEPEPAPKPKRKPAAKPARKSAPKRAARKPAPGVIA
jgi:chemotaxis signal transduction protein